MDLAFTLAEAGIPFMLYPMPILGATAPVTPAGTAVVNNAEIVAAVTAVQLAQPGARIIHAGGPTALDMRTGAYFAAVPESMLLRVVQGQMAAFYGLPAGLGYGGTKAKETDAQAGWENALTMLTEFFAGADFVFGSGLLDGSQIYAPEQLVLDDEVFGMVTRLLRGVRVDEESLAVDLIKRMGFDGHYLFERHTRPTRGTLAGAPRRDRLLRVLARRRRALDRRPRPGARRRDPRRPGRPLPGRPRPRARHDHLRGRSGRALKGVPCPTQTAATSARASSGSCSTRRGPHHPRVHPRRPRRDRRHVPLAARPRRARRPRRHGRPRDHRRQAASRARRARPVHAPRRFVLGARDPEFDLPLDGEHSISPPTAAASFAGSRTARPSRKRDLEDTARIVQALHNVSARRRSSRPRTAPPRRACCTSSMPARAAPPSTPSSSPSRKTGRRAA